MSGYNFVRREWEQKVTFYSFSFVLHHSIRNTVKIELTLIQTNMICSINDLSSPLTEEKNVLCITHNYLHEGKEQKKDISKCDRKKNTGFTSCAVQVMSKR